MIKQTKINQEFEDELYQHHKIQEFEKRLEILELKAMNERYLRLKEKKNRLST